ncbi:Suppressor of fused protein (SUFU) [Pseudomonas saponiphila]|uniref:Suppressor of fused protein (SUFU) n=1 Tax=Pseudomonas saponiphila TaxID=556534 RepID=A0A1H4P8I5_9PSED|nr:suppressor of fused domain protein [Pseudomonas saponiphila]SEC03740.1 Suppressor of fused protein (SUFU) [Pseudomonas saponiphila]
MNFLEKLLNAFKKPTPQKAEPGLASSEPGAAEQPCSQYQPTEAQLASIALMEAGAACLDRHWQAVGSCEADVLGFAISPSFTGGPHWPSTRQAYRIVRRNERIILATEGLSDPFDGVQGDDLGNGFEMELFIETPDIPTHAQGAVGDVSPFADSWTFELLRCVAGTVADAGGYRSRLERYGVLSLELPGVSQSRAMSEQLPAHFVSADDCAGVLIGGPAADFPTRLDDMPLSPVTLVPVVLITASELDYVRNGGAQAREDLAARLNAAGLGHVSHLQRASVI